MSSLLSELHGLAGFAEFRLISPEGRVKRIFMPSSNLSDQTLRNIVERSESKVYFSAVPRTEMRGTRDAVGAAHAVWCDYDNAGTDPAWRVEPSAVVRTSPGKCQAYWLLEAELDDLDLVEAMNRSIAENESGDRQATDRARVLRLPGSRNQKYPDKPLVTLEVWNPSLRYPIEELREHYPANAVTSRIVQQQVHRATPDWLQLVFRGILDFLEANGFRPRWRGLGVMAHCPLHDDARPSLSLHPERGWKCFAGCGQGRLTRLAKRLGVRV